MVLFHKDFEKESLQTGDLFAIFGIYDETAKNTNVGKVTDEEEIIINRSKTKALLLAEEMKADITFEEENGEIRIIINKKRNK